MTKVVQSQDNFFLGDYKGHEALPAGNYHMRDSMQGPYIQLAPVELKEAITLDGGTTEYICNRVKQFLSPGVKAKYESVNIRYSRNVLLHGEPGTGKTMSVRQLAKYVVEELNGVVLWDLGSKFFANYHRFVSPDRFVLLVFEEFDSHLDMQEEGFLSLLDGVNSRSNTMVIATTNYFDRLSPRVYRAGRFDEILEVKTPNLSERNSYLTQKFPSISEEVRKQIVEATDGVPISELAAVVKRVYCFDDSVEAAVSLISGGTNTKNQTYNDWSGLSVDGKQQLMREMKKITSLFKTYSQLEEKAPPTGFGG